MPFVLRVTTLPPLADITRVPQIVLVDQTGTAVSLGTSVGVAMLVGEFLRGPPNSPQEITSDAQGQAIFGGISPLFSQDASDVQNGAALRWNGNGMLQLKFKKFKRLGITRVNTEAVTTDGGVTISPLTLTVTVAAADQTAGKTNKNISIPAGTRFGNGVIGAATQLVATSQDYTIPSGTTLSGNTATVVANCFVVKEPEAIVAINAAAINTVIDAALQNVDAATTITTVTNAAAIWPPGTGTTLALRIASQYLIALTTTLPGAVDVTNDITVIWCARRSSTIRQGTLANAVSASEGGRGRVSCLSAEPANGTSAGAAAAAITAAAALGSGDNLRQDRACISFPHTRITVPELGSISVLINPDGWMASVLSNFANERNPGANPAGLMDNIDTTEDAFVANPPVKGDYANLIAGGVCPILKDRKLGWKFLDGVTAVDPVAQPTRVPLKRRRMADEIQDSIDDIAAPFNNEPATQVEIDTFTGEIEAYLETLKSTNDPSRQRIVDYKVDPISGNTANLLAVGIFTIIVLVRTLSDMRNIIIQSTIGETVVIPA